MRRFFRTRKTLLDRSYFTFVAIIFVETTTRWRGRSKPTATAAAAAAGRELIIGRCCCCSIKGVHGGGGQGCLDRVAAVDDGDEAFKEHSVRLVGSDSGRNRSLICQEKKVSLISFRPLLCRLSVSGCQITKGSLESGKGKENGNKLIC